MQYFEDPDQLLRDINSINARAIIIDRTPLHDEDPEHHLVVQHVPMSLDGGSYPCWILSRRRVFDTLHRWQAIADGISPEGRGNTDRGLHFEFSALILTPRHD